MSAILPLVISDSILKSNLIQKAFLPLLGVVVLILGCSRSQMEEEIAGIYSGEAFGVNETIELRADGAFVQTLSLPSGEVLTHSANWIRINKTIQLSSYLCFYGTSIPKKLTLPPQQLSFATYIIRTDSLVGDWGSQYYTLQKK